MIMIKDNDFDMLEEVVAKAHKICSRILLFEAIEMEEDEVRLFLDRNHVSDNEVQNAYLELVREYGDITSGTRPGD